MDSFTDSTAKRLLVFTESLGSFRQSFVQVSVPSLLGVGVGASFPPLGPWPRELEDWLDTHWQGCTCRIPLLEIILEILGEWVGAGAGGNFFQFAYFSHPLVKT